MSERARDRDILGVYSAAGPAALCRLSRRLLCSPRCRSQRFELRARGAPLTPPPPSSNESGYNRYGTCVLRVCSVYVRKNLHPERFEKERMKVGGGGEGGGELVEQVQHALDSIASGHMCRRREGDTQAVALAGGRRLNRRLSYGRSACEPAEGVGHGRVSSAGCGAQFGERGIISKSRAKLHEGDAVAGAKPVQCRPLRSLRAHASKKLDTVELTLTLAAGARDGESHFHKQLFGVVLAPKRRIHLDDGVAAAPRYFEQHHGAVDLPFIGQHMAQHAKE